MKIDKIDEIVQKLPSNPGIQGKEEYFNSVVLLLLIPVNGEYHIVFEKRCQSIRQGGEICIPGGRFEAEDLTIENTALRETAEEIGIPIDKIKLIGRLDTVIAPMGAAVDVFVGTAEVSLEEMMINNDEVERVFSLPVSYFEKNKPKEFKSIIEVHPKYIDRDTNQEVLLFPAEELGLPQRYTKPWGGFMHKIYVYKTDEGVIWGITARIVMDFIKKTHS